MARWEYLRLDLNDTPRRSDGIDMLNRAGSEGWQLVSATGNGLALLKREIVQATKIVRRKAADALTG
jgi:hypothetical protein